MSIYPSRVQTLKVYNSVSMTVSASAASSSSLDKRGYSALGLIVPTIDSASIGAYVSSDDSTFVRLEDNAGAHVSFLTASTGSCALSGSSGFDYLEPWPYVKFSFGAAQTGGSRALTAVLQG